MQDKYSNFLANTQDGFDEHGGKLFSHEIVRSRLNEKLWPVYERTKNKYALSQGDVLYFYAGGQGPLGGRVMARAKLHSIIAPMRRIPQRLYATGVVDSMLRLGEIELIDPTLLKPILIQQGVIKEENKKWGAFLMGGFSRIPASVASVLAGEVV